VASSNDHGDGLDGIDSMGRFANAIVVTIEGLGTNLVGCYGNALTPTPTFDRFASQSLVADQFWMDGIDPVEVLESMWSGLHRRERVGAQGLEKASPPKIKIPGILVTDDPRVYEAALRYVDGEVQLVDIAYTMETRFSSLVSDALNQWIPNLEKYPWLWIHSRGLSGPWDAPYELRLAMCDEGDPQPPSVVEPPVSLVDSSTDPDRIFGWACGAGGQAIAMDEVWGLLTEAIQELGFESSAMVILAGIQGYPLGEHGMVGLGGIDAEDGGGTAESNKATSTDGSKGPGAMYAERLHCPLIIRPGDQLPLSIRFSQFVQPHHLARLLEEWLEGSASIRQDSGLAKCNDEQIPRSSEGEVVAGQGWTLATMIHGAGVDRLKWLPFQRSAMAWDESEVALMLPSWAARYSTVVYDVQLEAAIRELAKQSERISDQAESLGERGEIEERNERVANELKIELFAMPDDRWQQNEISARAPAIIDAMNSVVNAWMQIGVHGRDRLAQLLWSLDEALLTPIR